MSDTFWTTTYRSCFIHLKWEDRKEVVTWQTPDYTAHQANTLLGAKRAISEWWQEQIDRGYSTHEFEVSLYKRPNQYGIFHRPTKNWVCFGKKKKRLIQMAAELNMGDRP